MHKRKGKGMRKKQEERHGGERIEKWKESKNERLSNKKGLSRERIEREKIVQLG